jgi:dipeptidyl aminopeptidase/acylaminoacyl peptidase
MNPPVEAVLGNVSIAGERLAYTLALSGSQIWQIEEGKSPRPFIRSAVFDAGAVFSPDGTRVVFHSNRSQDADHGNALFGARADGAGIVQLTGKEVIFASMSDWSPDGKWLVFSNQREDGNFDIVAMDSGGGALRRLTTASNFNTEPRFSRDGSRVWFVSNRTGRNEVWSVPFTGGAETQFTHEGRRTPSESVDGKTLYLLDSARNLYARPVAGGPEKRLVSGVLSYAVVDNGLYLAQADQERPAGTVIQDAVLHFTDLQGGHDRTMSNVPEFWGVAENHLTVSPDRKRILYTALPGYSAVIQMIEGFR